MKPVTLNLATRPFRNNLLVGSLLTVIGAGLVGATGYNLYVFLGYGSAYARLQQEQTEDRARIVTLQAEERRLADEIRSRDFRRAFERGKLANELVRKSAFSWTRLFNTLEGVVPPDVVMTAIRPNISAEAIVVRIEGVAKSSLAFLSFQERLLKNPLFTRVYPSSERRLNPNLPDITFLLTCDYLPQAPPSPDLVAADDPAAAGQAAAANAVTPPTGDAATGEPPTGEPATGAAPVPAKQSDTRVAQAATVGRDGLPVDAVPATMLAPGALYAPPAAAAAPAPAKKGQTRRPAAASDAKMPPPAAKPAAPGPPKGSTGTAVGSRGAGTRSGVPEDDAVPGAAKKAPDAPTAPATPARMHPEGVPWDPSMPRMLPAKQKGPGPAQTVQRPKTATRLDLPLSFTGAPVGDVYERLAEAHGVRFEFQPGVDRAVPVTVNLQGRKLEDALQLLGGQTNQRVTRIADGVYRVEGPESGRALGTAPVVEEPIGEDAP